MNPPVETTDEYGLEGRFDDVVAELQGRSSTADVGLLRRAYELARTAHADQSRKSGEPYIIHPLSVAQTIARLGLDDASVAAGLMHDAVEDSDLTIFELTESFGREIAQLVDGVTKLGKVPYLSRKENQAESFRKMLLAMSRDIRVLLVKLADRLDNMRTLEHMPRAKQERIARETMEIYAPLARRLGIDWLRIELQDLSFRYLEPVVYREVHALRQAWFAAQPTFLEDALEALRLAFADPQALARKGDSVEAWNEAVFGPVELRCTVRSVYTVHEYIGEQQRQQDGEPAPGEPEVGEAGEAGEAGEQDEKGEGEEDEDGPLSRLGELVSFQIVTRDRAACYAALGQIHAVFKPVPGRFRDYVALPRPNHYQALHTAVVDRTGTRLEAQIRSQRMDAVAERGIVADLSREGDESRLEWLKSLMDWQDEVHDPNEFIEAVKADLFADEVYAFTPTGEIRTFPKGATPIDFAFAIHTDVGMHCSGARVNGQVVPLRYRLRQGDTVEILTTPRVEPRREWLAMTASSKARAKIKHHIRQQEKGRRIDTGRRLLEQALATTSVELSDLETSDQLAARLEPLGISGERGFDGLLEELGAGSITTSQVLDGVVDPEPDASLISRVLRRVSGRVRLPVVGGGKQNPILLTKERVAIGTGMVQLSSCCNPVPGDPLVGFLAPGRGIVAHVQGCPEALDQLDDRRVFLSWEGGLRLQRPVTLQVRTANTVGLLAEMSRAFSQHGVNIKQANCRAYDSGRRAINTFHATVGALEQLEGLIMSLKGIRGVSGVERVFSDGAA